jgi:Carboxypeptidase regulatory-like domain
MYSKAVFILTLALMFVVSFNIPAQTITGRISGTITDPTGAVLAGATVTVTNEATGQSRTVQTNTEGFYVVPSLLPGNYKVSVENPGFKKGIKNGNTLIADGRLTVDFRLEAGQVSDTVEVTAVGETVNTISGESARTLDGAQLRSLALNGRNYMEIVNLLPGAPLLTGSGDALNLMTSLSSNQPINGGRGNSNMLTIDGQLNTVSGSFNSQINNVGIDFIQEVDIKTASFSAEYGRKSGASINVVTKSGTNEFHGSVWEYLRNDALDANTPTNNARSLSKPALRYNNFGWSLGGPIIKDKFFFFGGMEWKYIRRAEEFTARLPSRAERNGDFSFSLRGPDNIIGTADDGALRDPRNPASSCTAPQITNGVITRAAVRTGCFPNNTIPADRITADGKALMNVLNRMEQLAVSYEDFPRANNTSYQMPNPFDFRQEIVRLDYKFNDKHTIYGRYLHDRNIQVDPRGTFITSDLPTIQSLRNRPGYNIQVAHTWLISPTLINEGKVSTSWAAQRIPPANEDWKRDNYGFAFQQIFPNGGPYEQSIPNVSFSGGYTNFEGAAASLHAPTLDFTIADTISWVRGPHTIKSGIVVVRNRQDQNARSLYAGNISFNTAGNTLTTNNSMADALLGNFRTYSEAQLDQLGMFRFWQIEAFVNDTWRVTPKLSLDFGARYAYFQPTITTANNIANFDPALYDPAQAVTVLNNGTIDTTKPGNRFNGLVRVGGGTPADQLGRVPNANDSVVLAVPATGRRGIYRPQHVVAPRFSFAFAPFADGKTSIRGGFGMYYDRLEGNVIFPSLSVPPLSLSSQYENANLAAITSGRTTVQPFGNITVIDPNLESPYVMNYSLGVQRELPRGILLEISYVGALGRHLTRRQDINQVPFDVLRANRELPTPLADNALRPFKGFSQINQTMSDANSNYNSLQVYAVKRKGNLTMSTSYTWSKSLSDTRGGSFEPIEDPLNRRYTYGPTNFDRRHIAAFTYTYALPGLKQSNDFIRTVAGGWEVSGITRVQTGEYLTVTGNSSIGGRRADYIGGDVEGPKTMERWFNIDAFANPPDDRRGTGGVGMVEGPGRFFWNFSLRKRFDLTERFNLQFQGDFFNIFNNVNLNNPSLDRDNSAVGTITGSDPARNIQIGLRLSF